jgi:DNA polymerase-3 subunit epsilon
MTATNGICADSGTINRSNADTVAAGMTAMTNGFPPRTIDAQDAERMIALLETSGQYRILRRLQAQPHIHTPDGTPTRRGLFLDVETTGLNSAADEVIELAMIPFDFADDGRIFVVHEPFSRLRDPGRPIPTAITELTGITDAMVAGASIEAHEIEAFLAPASLVIAHNAGFDRPFCEKLCADFAAIPWACSWREIAWAHEGFDGARLSHLAAGYGLFFDGHRAVHDCRAGIEILGRTLPRSGCSALAALLLSARQPRWRLWATGAPFGKRGILKERGYRWHAGSDGRPKSWHVDVIENMIQHERQFLRQEIYGHDVDIKACRITAFDRYADRC